MKVDLSIILPALNEAAIIAGTLEQLAVYLVAHPELGTTEVIVVAAGTDATADIARGFTDRFTRLQVVTPPRAIGKGNDVKLGFQAATGTAQIFLDADLSTPLHHIAPLVARLRAGDDIVIGCRNLRRIHSGIKRTILSLASNLLVRVLFWLPISDTQCGFKGFRQAAARTVFGDAMQITGWAFDIEVLVAGRKAGYRIAQMPIADWHEARKDDLRSEGLGQAARRTLQAVLALRLSMWQRSLMRHMGLVIVAAGILHAALAWLIGTRQSIWFDEAYSINLIERSAAHIIRLTAVDVHPPLYYLMLQAWAAVFGTTDMALRSFSVVCGAAAAMIGLLLVKRLWDARTALWAAPFIVVAPFLLRYSFEIRMYALASLLCMGATYVLVAAVQASPGRTRWLLWLAYALLVAAGMYTLYYTVLMWVTHLLWYLYVMHTSRPSVSWKKLLHQPLIWADAGAVVLFSAWVPLFLRQLHAVQTWFWIGPVSYSTVAGLWSLTLNYLTDSQLGPWPSVIFVAALAVAFYFVITALRISAPAARQHLMLLVLYAIVPVVILYGVSLPPLRPLFTARYDSQVVLGTYLLLGVSAAIVLAHRKSVWLRVMVLGLCAVLIQGVVHLYQFGNDHPNYRQMAQYIQAHTIAGEPVITAGPQDYMIFHHYLPNRHVVFYAQSPLSSDGGYAMLQGSPLRVFQPNSFNGRPVWVIYSGATPAYVPAFHARSSGTRLGDFSLYRYDPIAPSAMPPPVPRRA